MTAAKLFFCFFFPLAKLLSYKSKRKKKMLSRTEQGMKRTGALKKGRKTFSMSNTSDRHVISLSDQVFSSLNFQSLASALMLLLSFSMSVSCPSHLKVRPNKESEK